MNRLRLLLTLAICSGALIVPPFASAAASATCVVGFAAVDVKGVIDSFDSTQGCYGCALPGGGANVGSEADVRSNQGIFIRSGDFIGGAITSTLGNVTIMKGAIVDGDVKAGTTVINLGAVNGTITENEPGVPIVFPPAPPCTPSASLPPGLTGPTGAFVYDRHGNLTVNGGVSLAPGTYCFGRVKVQGSGHMEVDPASGRVVMTVNGPITVSGGGVVNPGLTPAMFLILSAYTGPKGVTLSGGTANAIILAPGTDVILSGGAELAGVVIGGTLTVTGADSAIHCDVSL